MVTGREPDSTAGASSGAAASSRGVRVALDTATDVGSVALSSDGGLRVEIALGIRAARSEGVLPALAYALDRAGIAPARVDELIVGAGPGSFTGVRIAASVAKGWAMAREIPLFAYPSLMGLAVGTGAAGPVCAMFDARRGEVYAACYEVEGREIRERLAPGAWTVDEVLSMMAERGLEPTFAGEGALRYAETIRAHAPRARVLPSHLAIPRAAALLWLRETIPDRGRVDRPSAWEPLYVREWRTSNNGEEG